MRAADAGPSVRRPARRVARAAAAVLRWIEPEDNPSGVVYGTLAVGAVLAAESTRRETFADTVVATLIVLALYWVAHTYATVVGRRLTTRQTLTARGWWDAFVHEGAIVKGAAIPIAVLGALWVAGVSLDTAVVAALWTCALVLALFEVVATARSRAGGAQRALHVLVGVALGAGILLVRAVLH